MKSPRIAAISFALLMLAPSLPLAAATHTEDAIPDLLQLPHARPTDECIGLGIPAEQGRLLAALQAGDREYFADDKGVPSLCGLDGQPMTQWVTLIEGLDTTLETFRATANELQRQADARYENTYPETCNIAGSPACIKPIVTLLDDSFDGRRVGGFGDWTAYSESGAQAQLRIAETHNFSGTLTTWRFGDDTGYQRGAREFLVSPEIDLRAIRGNAESTQLLAAAIGDATRGMRTACRVLDGGGTGIPQLIGCQNNAVIFGSEVTFASLIETYENAVGEIAKSLPIGQPLATLSFQYKLNMADTADGFRIWAYIGDQAPDRVALYGPEFSHGAAVMACRDASVRDIYSSIPGNTNPYAPETTATAVTGPYRCPDAPATGRGTLLRLPGMSPVAAFPSGTVEDGFTGHTSGITTVELDITNWTGKRAWLVFEIATTPDLNRGGEYFAKERFPQQQDEFGFTLTQVTAKGDGYPRNVRAHEPTSPVIVRVDETRRAATIVPGDAEPIVLWVHNGGYYTEDVTLDVTIRERAHRNAAVETGVAFGTVAPIVVTDLQPNEVRAFPVAWPEEPVDGRVYDVSAKVTPTEFPAGFDPEDPAEPSGTNVRIPNWNTTNGNGLVHRTFEAVLLRSVTAVAPPTGGNPLLVCAGDADLSIECDKDNALVAARKGVPRHARLTVLNDGNTPIDARATLSLTLDGIDKAGSILDGATRELDGLVPREARTETWSLALNDPGIYEALVTFSLPDGTPIGTPVERLLFAQRTTGLVCFDDLDAQRDCSASFSTHTIDALEGANITAAARGDDGLVYVVTESTETRGGLYRELANGTWEKLADLSLATLRAVHGEPLPGRPYGTLRQITWAPQGELVLTGDNLAAFTLGADRVLRRVASPDLGAPVVTAGGNYEALTGLAVTLAGGVVRGVPPYTYEWTILRAPAGSAVTNESFASNTTAATTFTTDVDGIYRLQLNATDSLGRYQHALATVTAGSCRPSGFGLIADDEDFDSGVIAGVDSPGGATDIHCVTMTDTGSNGNVAVQVRLGGQDLTPAATSTRPLEVLLRFTRSAPDPVAPNAATLQADTQHPGPDYAIKVSWPGSGTPTAAFVNPTTGETVGGGRTATATFTPGGYLNVTFARNVIGSPADGTLLDNVTVTTSACIGTDTCDRTVLDTAPDAGQAHYRLGRDGIAPRPLAAGSFTLQSTETSGVTLTWAPLSGETNPHRFVILRSTSEEGPYAIVGTTTGTTYTDPQLPSGTLAYYMLLALDSYNNPTASLTANITTGAVLAYTATAVHNGTLYATAIPDGIHAYNATTRAFERLTLPVANATGALGFQPAMRGAASDGTHLVLVGDQGVTLRRNATTWTLLASEDRATCSSSTAALGLCNRTLRSVTLHDGTFYAVGDSGAALTLSGTTWQRLPPLPVVGDVRLDTVLGTHLGTLFAISLDDTDLNEDDAPRFFACEGCDDPEAAIWREPAVSMPNVLGASGKVLVAARPRAALVSESATMLLGDGASILRYDDTSFYDNREDWTTAAVLAPGPFGAIQSPSSSSTETAFRGTPPTTSSSATNLRVTFTHHVLAATTSSPVAMRAIVSQYPTTATNTSPDATRTCPATAKPTDINTPCRAIISAPVTFTQPTRVTRGFSWVNETHDIRLPAPFTAGSAAIEFVAAPANVGTAWAIDEVIVWTLDGPGGNPTGVLLAYFGPLAQRGPTDAPCLEPLRDRCNYGTWGTPTLPGGTPTPFGPAAWRPAIHEVFAIDTTSAWHLSRALADRPVWVANDEVGPGTPGRSTPHLLDNWDTRLISPVIDLGDAYSPVLSFRHKYSFRSYVNPASNVIESGDGGQIEVQYLRHDSECGLYYVGTCWSPFFVLTPEGGYPNRTALNAADYTHRVGTADNVYPAGMGPGSNAGDGPALSYYYRNALPDAEGVIGDVRDTSKYEEVRVSLTNKLTSDPPVIVARDAQGAPVNLSGRQVRIAFHVVTVHSRDGEWNPTSVWLWNTTFVASDGTVRSYPGEGWYITDFKVQGAHQLGVDLALEDLRFNVGYDAKTIGVGPGTRVPINFTVHNNGVFEALGYTATIDVLRVLDAVSGRTELVTRLALPQQPALDPDHSVNHTLQWDVPAVEDAQYVLKARLVPVGISEDEDPTDNVGALGSLIAPVVARTTRQFNVHLTVTPENATSDITRYVPIFIDNTGNVPLEGIQVTRAISLLGGQTSEPEERRWTTERPAPAGTRTSLAALDDDFDPIEDLFWKAPERANYFFLVDARVTIGGIQLESSTDKRVSAFATYLFDDVDTETTGESITGEWDFTPEWRVADEGFRSDNAYAFGDALTGRYPADADARAVSPVIDLANARSAQLGFYHRFRFEPGFDGGLVEASIDGGATWTTIAPVADLFNALPNGYMNEPLKASSVLHESGDPSDPRYGFTGDSSQLASAVDGWILSVFDLTTYDGITKRDVPYDTLRAPIDSIGYGPAVLNGNATYTSGSWKVGPVADYRYWEVQNLTENRLRSVTGNESFWWSGSASIADDGLRPTRNFFLDIPVDLTPIVPGAGDLVEVEWWEWMDRSGMRMKVDMPGTGTIDGSKTLSSTATTTSFNAVNTVRLNLSTPRAVEQKGDWYRMVAVLDGSYVGRTFNVSFVYSPLVKPTGTSPTDSGATAAQNYADTFRDDPGFAIDGFTVRAYKLANGQRSDERVLMDEADAWNRRSVTSCAGATAMEFQATRPPNANDIPCYAKVSTGRVPLARLNYTSIATTGFAWNLTTGVNGTGGARWNVVDARDETGSAVRTTGEAIKAFYTGNLRCGPSSAADPPSCVAADPVEACNQATYDCVRPGTETRLVTPAVDLSVVSGDSAILTFWHRYAFHYDTHLKLDPIGSGGVIEIQEYDPLTGEWGEWKQLYSKPEADEILPKSSKIAYPASADVRYGYPMYVAQATPSAIGGIFRLDAPFEARYNETMGRNYTYLYSGKSTSVAGNANGWLEERFDVQDYIGKKVRFGFHASFMNYARTSQGATSSCINIAEVDGQCMTGWWVRDVKVVGDVLAGHDTLLRIRAATDGNVDEGYWQFDDIGLYGGRYQRNVAAFIEESKFGYGALAGQTVEVPITVRNLGTTVRRDLALDVRLLGNLAGLGTLSGAGGAVDPENLAIYRIAGIDLAPGDSRTVHVAVTAPAILAEEKTGTIYVELRELNPALNTYQRISDNEVQGFLIAEMPMRFARQGHLAVGQPVTTPTPPELYAPVEMRVPITNDGVTRLLVNMTCTAETIRGWTPADRSKNEGRKGAPIVDAGYPCERPQGAHYTLEPGESTEVVARATPTVEGTLRFALALTTFDVAERALEPTEVFVPIGIPSILFSEDFTNPNTVKIAQFRNWSSAPLSEGNPEWSYTRGDDAPGSLLVGLNDTFPAGKPPNILGAQSVEIDLRNMTAGAFLTLSHLDRMAKGDGAHIKAQIKVNEGSSQSWLPAIAAQYTSPPTDCIVVPVGNYEGGLVSQLNMPPDGEDDPEDDLNGGYLTPTANAGPQTTPKFNGPYGPTHGFFTAKDGLMENEWQTAVFDLAANTCRITVDGQVKNVPLVGHVVRFLIYNYAGPIGVQPPNGIAREASYGFYVDDVSISPYQLDIRPDTQGARLLDNTTKDFIVLVTNRGAASDLVRLTYDAGNSSAPADAIVPPTEPVTLKPGETKQVRVQVKLPRDPSLLATEYEAQVRVESLSDPAVGAVTRLKLLFAPREWADLGVSAEAPTQLVQEGTEAFLPITIQNNGLVESVPTTVRIVDRWTQDGITHETTTELDLLPIASFYQDAEESLRVLQFRWRPEIGSLGEHTITITVDPLALGEEYTRTDNVVTITGRVGKLLIPDLSLTSTDAVTLRDSFGVLVAPELEGEVARYEIAAGELVSFDVRVRNVGAGGVTNVDVRPFLGALSLPAKTVPYIAPGAETLVTFNWLAQKGDYQLEVIVRSEQVEVSTANNRFPGSGVALLIVKGFEVEGTLVAPPDTLEPGTEVPATLTLVNTGNAGEDLRLATRLPEAWSVRLDVDTLFLRAGERRDVPVTILVPDTAVAGEQFINVLAVSRENPMKVAPARTTLDVRAFHEGRVLPSGATVTPPTMAIPVTLANDGNSLEPWSLTLRLPPGWASEVPMPIDVVVPPHGTATVEVQVSVPPQTAPGLRDIEVQARLPDGLTRTGSVNLEITPRRSASISLVTETPGESAGALAYPIVIENVGNVKRPFNVLLTEIAPGIEARVVPATFDLAPGTRATATLLVTPSASAASGTYDITAYALFAGVHPDTVEGRANTRTLSVTVQRPDLVTTGIEQVPRSGARAGDAIVVKVPIANRGDAPVSDVVVHLYADDVFIAETRIPRIGAGETREAVLQWTALGGDHALTVVVDPYEDTVDASREDNAVSTLASVTGATIAGGVAAGRLGTPGPGLFSFLAAFAVAAAMARRWPGRAKK